MAAWHELEESQIPTLTNIQLFRIFHRTAQIVDTMDYDARMCQAINYNRYVRAKEIRDLCNRELDKRGE